MNSKKENAQRTEELLRLLAKEQGHSVSSDLHIHTSVSDGSDSFKDVVIQALERNLTHIAFTNHDTTVGLDYAISLAASFGVAAIGGVEISAWDFNRSRKVHILGYGLQSNSPAIRSLCSPLLEQRRKNTSWQMNHLIKAGYAISAEKIQEVSALSTSFYKQHLMAVITDEPFQSEIYQSLYQHLFKGSGLCVRDMLYVDACDAVRAIVSDGGVAVLAHPGQHASYEMVPDLVSCGLKGIERFHPDHNRTDWECCDQLEQQYDLFHTGGSDYHGAYGAVPHLGLCEAPISAFCSKTSVTYA